MSAGQYLLLQGAIQRWDARTVRAFKNRVKSSDMDIHTEEILDLSRLCSYQHIRTDCLVSVRMQI